MKCRYCGEEMYMDVCEVHSIGFMEKYWRCVSCDGSCVDKVEYGRSHIQRWQNGEKPECFFFGYYIGKGKQ